MTLDTLLKILLMLDATPGMIAPAGDKPRHQSVLDQVLRPIVSPDSRCGHPWHNRPPHSLRSRHITHLLIVPTTVTVLSTLCRGGLSQDGLSRSKQMKIEPCRASDSGVSAGLGQMPH